MLCAAAVAAPLVASTLLPADLHASPRDVVLRWIPPDGAVDGYRVHLGWLPGVYDETVELGPVPIDPDGIGRATLALESTRDYSVALTAYNGMGESPLSNEIAVAASACDPLACDDGRECTADDCGAGGCTHSALPDGTVCGAGSGACRAGACEPVECTEASQCDDADACNGSETCDAAGDCVAGAPPDCGKPTQCSIPSCDPTLGCVQVPLPDGTPCDDGRRPTLDDRCRAGVCEGVHKRLTGRGPK